jgi:hypothetical protein
VVHRRGRSIFVETRFKSTAGKLLLFATVTLLEQPAV